MFKITKSSPDDTKFSLECYFFNTEQGLDTFLYSAKNIDWDDVAHLVQGRMKETDIDMAEDLLKYTGSPVIINDTGELSWLLTGHC